MSKNNIKVFFRLGAQFFRGCYSHNAWTAEATFTKLPETLRRLLGNVIVYVLNVFCAVSRVFVRAGFPLFCARFAVHYLTI